MGRHETTGVYGCYLVNILPDASDARGQLTRPFGKINMALNVKGADVDDIVVRSHANVFRGMHIQHADAPMWKYVRVTSGIILGAVIDTSKVRQAGRVARVTLSAHAPLTGPRRDVGLLIPPWCAWGYYAESGGSEVAYRLWGQRVAEAERSIHYTSFGAWSPDPSLTGLAGAIMSDRDRSAKPLSEVDTGW
jgi:dTDP-4-dehydrorhamnose 3,5-epimerase-like enzyme